MRTVAQETAPQIALRDYSKEVVGEGQYIRFWWIKHFTKGFLLVMKSWCHREGTFRFSRYEEMQRLGSWNQFLKIPNYLKACSVRFRGAQGASLSTLNSLRGCWVSTAAAAQSSVSSEADGKCYCCWSVQFSSVAQLCLTLCNPMNRSTPGLPVHHQLPEFTQTHVHWVGDAIQPSHPLSSPSPPPPNPSQHQSPFQWVNSSHEVAKVLEFQL